MTFRYVTNRYRDRLSPIPDDWSWRVWEDVVDKHPTIFVRLCDQRGRCAGHGWIDMEWDESAVLKLAKKIAERSKPGRHGFGSYDDR
jgi:hypothetical protein